MVATPKQPKVFLSHSWSDRDKVRPLAEALLRNGIEVWFDEWEIGPGDSLVQKINEGLAECNVFLVAVSTESVASKWVREELSSAIVRRIEESTRLIPLRVDGTPVPTVINHLLWVAIEPLDEAVKKITQAVFGVSDKPSIGKRPDYIEQGIERQQGLLGGLGPETSAVLREIVRQARQHEHPFWELVDIRTVQQAIGLDDTEFDDALDVLVERGLITPLREHPMQFVKPNPRAWTYLVSELDFDLVGAMRRVAVAAVGHEQIDAAPLEHETGLTLEPLMTAVYVLEALGVLDVYHGGFGAGRPYGFVHVRATRKTREWVRLQGNV